MDCSSGCGTGCGSHAACPCPVQGNPKIDTLEKVLNCYWQNHQQYDVEKAWYGSLESLEVAVHDAALSLADENIDLDHVPDRIPLTELATAKRRLLDAVSQIALAENFDELLEAVRHCLADLSGIDEELEFRTALRIGMHLQLEPQRIYLHPEVRDGAAQLVDLDEEFSSLEKNHLPSLFHHPDLPAVVIQGCLTICREQLKWLRLNGVLSRNKA